jgi:hypothetical protein
MRRRFTFSYVFRLLLDAGVPYREAEQIAKEFL